MTRDEFAAQFTLRRLVSEVDETTKRINSTFTFTVTGDNNNVSVAYTSNPGEPLDLDSILDGLDNIMQARRAMQALPTALWGYPLLEAQLRAS